MTNVKLKIFCTDQRQSVIHFIWSFCLSFTFECKFDLNLKRHCWPTPLRLNQLVRGPGTHQSKSHSSDMVLLSHTHIEYTYTYTQQQKQQKNHLRWITLGLLIYVSCIYASYQNNLLPFIYYNGWISSLCFYKSHSMIIIPHVSDIKIPCIQRNLIKTGSGQKMFW